jgi:phosphopantetheinyl transferase
MTGATSGVTLTVARFTLEDRADWLASALTVLSDAELARVAAIRGPDARSCHAIGRAMIRVVGASVSGCLPEAIVVAVSDAGKPRLADVPDTHVSVAHTSRIVVVASAQTAVGVDVESTRAAGIDPRRVAARFFAESEVASLSDVPDNLLSDWFVSAWTVKEAVGKALGVGIVPALSGAVLAVQPGGCLALAEVWAGPPASSWSIHQLIAPGGRERMAVALPSPGVELSAVLQLTLESFSSACRSD